MKIHGKYRNQEVYRIARIPRDKQLGNCGRRQGPRGSDTRCLFTLLKGAGTHCRVLCSDSARLPCVCLFPFSSCVFPAVLLPAHVNTIRSQSTVEGAYGAWHLSLATPYCPWARVVPAKAAAGPARANGQSLQEKALKQGQDFQAPCT